MSKPGDHVLIAGAASVAEVEERLSAADLGDARVVVFAADYEDAAGQSLAWAEFAVKVYGPDGVRHSAARQAFDAFTATTPWRLMLLQDEHAKQIAARPALRASA